MNVQFSTNCSFQMLLKLKKRGVVDRSFAPRKILFQLAKCFFRHLENLLCAKHYVRIFLGIDILLFLPSFHFLLRVNKSHTLEKADLDSLARLELLPCSHNLCDQPGPNFLISKQRGVHQISLQPACVYEMFCILNVNTSNLLPEVRNSEIAGQGKKISNYRIYHITFI